MGRILALDIGKKRVGLAISDELKMIASPLTFVEFAKLDDEISRVMAEYDIDEVVVGLPRNMDGTEGSLAGFAREASEKIKEFVGTEIDVVLVDETLTSVEAESRLRERKKSYEKGDIDAEAATVILENYMKENYAE